MTRDQLLEQLRPLDDTQVASLGASLGATVRAAPRAAIEVYQGEDHYASLNAQQLLMTMEDLAIGPMVEGPEPRVLEQRKFLIEAAVEAEFTLRRKVVAGIDKLLDDQSPIPLPPAKGPVGQKAPQHRVCDEAYLLMPSVLHFGEKSIDAGVDANVFFNASVAVKNAQINKARASAIWQRALRGDKEYMDYIDSHPDAGPHRTLAE